MTEKFELIDAQKTKELGHMLAHKLALKPSLIFLRGELGTGKTTFAQGFIGALINYSQPILSPTYAYMHHYQAQIPIYHFDLFRIEEPRMIVDLGLESFIDDKSALRLIEWPERLEHLTKEADLDITLTHDAHGRIAFIFGSF